MSLDRLTGAYHLSRNTCDADRWTAEQWLRLYDAYQACGWDFTPDTWTRNQINAALLHGRPPQWDCREKPVYFTHFVVLLTGEPVCECCANKRNIDLGDRQTDLWEVGSDGWKANPGPCLDCGSPIYVIVG